jgi:MFS family permease
MRHERRLNTLRFVAAASVFGSVIEWYDLFVYGSLVVVLSGAFFPSQNPSVSVLYALGAFVAGAAVRPLGGAVFGRIGDKLGRRRAFLMTVIVMGVCAFLTGLLPTYGAIGILAPLLLVGLRITEGLALGGEFGGATVYLAEHAPASSRGAWTSLVQVSATVGLLLSTVVVLIARLSLSQTAFADWGWRVPFLFSAVLVIVAVWLRLRLTETPLFTELVAEGKTTKEPIRETFSDRKNVKALLIAMLVVSGSSVIWHTAQFYSSVFMQTTLKVSFTDASTVTVAALALGAPFFVFFGWLSDRVGRKKVILIGNMLGLAFIPLYLGLDAFSAPLNLPGLVTLGFAQVFVSAMVYGPLGAYLVESFPTRIRYTSLAIAYGIGTGDIGDGTLLIAPWLALVTVNMYAGLLWIVAVPMTTAIGGLKLMRETRGTSLSMQVYGSASRSDASP